MIFAVGKEINVVTFKTKYNDFYNKTFKNEGWNLYAFSASRLEKGSFLSKRGWNFIFVTAGHPEKNFWNFNL